MTPALIMLVVPGLPSYNGVEVYYLKGVIGLPIVISFRDRWSTHIFFLEMGSLMTSSSSAGPIQISKFPEPWSKLFAKVISRQQKSPLAGKEMKTSHLWFQVYLQCFSLFPWAVSNFYQEISWIFNFVLSNKIQWSHWRNYVWFMGLGCCWINTLLIGRLVYLTFYYSTLLHNAFQAEKQLIRSAWKGLSTYVIILNQLSLCVLTVNSESTLFSYRMFKINQLC